MKKLLYLIALLCISTGVWAQTTTATYGMGNGTFYNASGTDPSSGGFDAKTFVSNTTPAVTVTCSYDTGLNCTDAADGARLGANNGANTYTISVPDGYIIVSYSFDCKAVKTEHPARTLTTESGVTLDIPTGDNTTWRSVSETYINKQSTYFKIETTDWSPINTRNFKIKVRSKFYEEEKTTAAGLEDGYYVVQGRSNGKSGFWYHDLSQGDSRYFRISSRTTSSPDVTSFTGNLKYVWRLTKDGNGYFTLQNVGTDTFAPADAQKNKNFQGTTTANFAWDSEHAAIKQTNYTDGGDLYVHCNALPNVDINLSYWSSGPGSSVNDGSGSLLAPRFFKVSDADINLVLNLKEKIAEVNALQLGDGLHKYTTNATPSEVNAEIATANTLYGTAGAAYSQVTAEIATLQSYIDNATLNLPTTGGFYRFHIGNKYMCNVADEDNVRTTTTTSNDASTVFYLDADNHLISLADGLGFNFGYCKPTGDDILVLNSFAFTESSTSGYYNIHSSKGTATNVWSDRDITISGDKLAEGAGAWTIEDVESLPVTISSAKYATLYAPVALTIPTGVIAYRVSAVSTTEATLTEIATTIPANTPVIISSETAGSKNFTIDANNTDAAPENKLEGSVVAKAWTDEYTLQLNDTNNEVGLYGNSPTNGVIPGFKAYMPKSAVGANNVKGFAFAFDTETLVKAIEAAQNPGKVVYDLNGRRVENPEKGLYIVNGKKVLVK